jgi:thymidylate kinase
MNIICIEGCHGCGKTEIISDLRLQGYNVYDEGFLDMPDYKLNPQSFTMELIWVCQWIQRILKDFAINNEKLTYFADRSPYSALFYAPNGTLMESVIKRSIDDLMTNANISIKTIYIRVDNDILWSRISERLERDPSRIKYNENSREWMDTTVNFYESHLHLFNHVISNNTSRKETVKKILDLF